MAKTLKVVWLGDEDPSQQTIEDHGVTYVKGEPVTLPANSPHADRLKGNPFFAVNEDADVVDGGDAEKDALKAELEARGIAVRANASVASMRASLAAGVDTGEA